MTTANRKHSDRRHTRNQTLHKPSDSLTRAERATSRGFTLLEILVVVAIASMLAAGVSMGVYHLWQDAKKKLAARQARVVLSSVVYWRGCHDGDCPTVAVLVQDRVIDRAAKTTDPWGSAFQIECDGEDAVVSSLGPDRRLGTPDDILVPEHAAMAAR